jgi:hypothetical protein
MRMLERGTDNAGVAQVVVVSIVDGMILYWAQVVVLSTQCSHAKRRCTLDTIVCTEHPSAPISTPSSFVRVRDLQIIIAGRHRQSCPMVNNITPLKTGNTVIDANMYE